MSFHLAGPLPNEEQEPGGRCPAALDCPTYRCLATAAAFTSTSLRERCREVVDTLPFEIVGTDRGGGGGGGGVEGDDGVYTHHKQHADGNKYDTDTEIQLQPYRCAKVGHNLKNK